MRLLIIGLIVLVLLSGCVTNTEQNKWTGFVDYVTKTSASCSMNKATGFFTCTVADSGNMTKGVRLIVADMDSYDYICNNTVDMPPSGRLIMACDLGNEPGNYWGLLCGFLEDGRRYNLASVPFDV